MFISDLSNRIILAYYSNIGNISSLSIFAIFGAERERGKVGWRERQRDRGAKERE